MVNDSGLETPIFVCEHCGKITRILFFEEGDIVHCPFCKAVMTQTDYSILEDELPMYFGNNEEAKEFQCNVFHEYVKYSDKFDIQTQFNRLDKEREMNKK